MSLVFVLSSEDAHVCSSSAVNYNMDDVEKLLVALRLYLLEAVQKSMAQVVHCRSPRISTDIGG